MLSVEQVASILAVPPDWVYRNKHALGCFQAKHGGRILFSENLIEAIKEGTYAIPDEIREVARKGRQIKVQIQMWLITHTKKKPIISQRKCN